MTATARHLTVAEVAARWACSRDFVEARIKDQSLACLKLSPRNIRVPVAVVEQFERERMGVQGSSPPAGPETHPLPTGASPGPNASGETTAQKRRDPSRAQQERMTRR